MFKHIGWDIGGAHLKATYLIDGHVMDAVQIPCELWRGLDRLQTAMISALAHFDIKNTDALHAVTMTGELVDLFPNRKTGVVEISHFVAKFLDEQTSFYAAENGFVTLTEVSVHAASIASTNWHASASLLAKGLSTGLLVDVGSTTTDIIPMTDGHVANIGLTDAMRMREDTLVYTGVVRTPLMALAQKIKFKGSDINVAAEYFATMADVYRLTDDLSQEVDMADTADGKGKSTLDSARRLARMIGHDVESESIETWKQLAMGCKELQLGQIKLAVLKHLAPNMPIVGAGAGTFLVKILANQLNRPYIRAADVLKMDLNEESSVCFPAYAVARLAFLKDAKSA